MVVHYFQPHAPYIGSERLRNKQYESGGTATSKIKARAESILDIYDSIESGSVSDEKLETVYKSNLQRVIQAAKPLIAESSEKTVITSDHGELLGEDGRYLHGGMPHPILCELPWFEVTEIKGNTVNIAEKVEQRERRSEERCQTTAAGSGIRLCVTNVL